MEKNMKPEIEVGDPKLPQVADIPEGCIKMHRGAITVHVAPQDVDGFKSAGYSVSE